MKRKHLVMLAILAVACWAGTAGAATEPISDTLTFTWDGATLSKSFSGPGEAVGEEIDFAVGTPTLSQTSFTSDFVYLVEPGTVTQTFSDGTVTGSRSDQLQAKISNENGIPTITVTMNSDEDPGLQQQVRGFLETGDFIDVTGPLFAGIDLGTHTTQVLAFSDVETSAVPIPPSALLLGSGLLGLVGFGWRRKRS